MLFDECLYYKRNFFFCQPFLFFCSHFYTFCVENGYRALSACILYPQTTNFASKNTKKSVFWVLDNGFLHSIPPISQNRGYRNMFSPFLYPEHTKIFLKCSLLNVFTQVVTRVSYYSSSNSLIHTFTHASLGMRSPPLGDTSTLPTFGPSGRQERLNCWLKNLQ